MQFFLWNLVPFTEQDYEKQKESGTIDQSIFNKLQNKFRKTTLLVSDVLPDLV